MKKTVAELRVELTRLDEAIAAFERLAKAKEEKTNGGIVRSPDSRGKPKTSGTSA